MRLVTKAELARWAGVSRNATSKLCKPGGSLFDATVGRKVDAEHPLVLEWLSRHDVHALPPVDGAEPPKAEPPKAEPPKAEPPKAEPPKAEPLRAEPPKAEPPGQIEDLEQMTVRDVVMRFGSADGFKRYVDSLKSIAEYKHRELRIRQQRGDLIERETVAGAVFALMDVAFSRLVSDVPDAVSKQVLARAEAGGEDALADIAALIRDANSRVIKNAKESITRARVV